MLRYPPRGSQVTIGLVDASTKDRELTGLCSTYLHSLQDGDTVLLSSLRSSFKLPADPEAPLMLVGPGTGLAPIMGFLYERSAMQAQGTKLGPAVVYFGCRTSDEVLYAQQLKEWEAAGIVKVCSLCQCSALVW